MCDSSGIHVYKYSLGANNLFAYSMGETGPLYFLKYRMPNNLQTCCVPYFLGVHIKLMLEDVKI